MVHGAVGRKFRDFCLDTGDVSSHGLNRVIDTSAADLEFRTDRLDLLQHFKLALSCRKVPTG